MRCASARSGRSFGPTAITGSLLSGKSSPYIEALTGADPDARAGYGFANHKGGWQADIPALRRLHPDLMDFDTWLAREGTALFEKASPRRGAQVV